MLGQGLNPRLWAAAETMPDPYPAVPQVGTPRASIPLILEKKKKAEFQASLLKSLTGAMKSSFTSLLC